jgi:hypothetical protein
MAPSYCPSSETTAPINITKINTKDCQSSCDLITKYSQSGVTSTDYASYISIVPNIAQSGTLFNGQAYGVNEVRLYSAPLHTYSSSITSNAELLIIHTNLNRVATAPLLIISVPIIVSETPNLASLSLESIIKETSANSCLTKANSAGCIEQSAPLRLNTIDFNLRNYVPKGEYYFYKGVFSFQKQNSLSSCDISSNIVVYSPSSGGITIDNATFTILKNLLTPPTAVEFQIYANPTLYLNTGGSGKNAEEEIYIDCQPVNESTDEVYVPVGEINSAAQNINALFQEVENIGESPITNALFGVLLMLGIYFIARQILDKMGSIHKG